MLSHTGPSPLFNKTKLSLLGGTTTGAYAHPPPPWATKVRLFDTGDSRESKFQKKAFKTVLKTHSTLFSLIFFEEHARTPPPPKSHTSGARQSSNAPPLALKLVYGPTKIFGSDKPICLKLENSKSLANGRSRVGPSPLFNFFF